MRPQSETRCIERSDDLRRGLVLVLVLVQTIGIVTPAEAIETLAPRQPTIPVENIGMLIAYTLGTIAGALITVRPSRCYWVLPALAVAIVLLPDWRGHVQFFLAAVLMGGLVGAAVWPALHALCGAAALLVLPVEPMFLGLAGTRTSITSFFATLAVLTIGILILWLVWPRRSRASNTITPFSSDTDNLWESTVDGETMVDIVAEVISSVDSAD